MVRGQKLQASCRRLSETENSMSCWRLETCFRRQSWNGDILHEAAIYYYLGTVSTIQILYKAELKANIKYIMQSNVLKGRGGEQIEQRNYIISLLLLPDCLINRLSGGQVVFLSFNRKNRVIFLGVLFDTPPPQISCMNGQKCSLFVSVYLDVCMEFSFKLAIMSWKRKSYMDCLLCS